MKYAIVTFGCRVNQADSFAIEQDLRSRGAIPASHEEADVVIVNTCSVTASADQGARQTIRRIARANPGVQMIVTGCYATRRPDEISALPNVVQVVSNADKDELGNRVWFSGDGMLEFAGKANPVSLSTAERFGEGDGACGQQLTPGTAGRTALTLRVQTGCEERCSYCIIPRTRGRSRSRPLDAVRHDIAQAVAAGYKEIVITGVHLGSYGRDLGDGSSLATLVRALADWTGDVLFRISSLEPMDCTSEIMAVAASSDRIAPHFHLPLQHGSDGILRAMERPYTVSYYRRLLERIRAAIPHASIGSDIIVGFPGEDSVHFADMRAVLDDLPLTYLHVFPYSDRPGTKAAGLRPKVDGAAIRERAREVREIGERKASAFRRSQIGRTLRALTVDDGRSVVTDNYLKLRLEEPQQRNEWVDVRVTSELVGQAFRLARQT